jgi:hypothetical protein
VRVLPSRHNFLSFSSDRHSNFKSDLKTRFLAKSEKLRKSSAAAARQHRSTSSSTSYAVEATPPPLSLPDGSVAQPPPKGEKEDMQDFLDDLLT